nr:DUF4198 domain-containing protein [Sphingomonas liriopis]
MTGSAAAHEFWIQPGRFRLSPGETTSLAVLVGHGAERERWRMRLRRIVRFASIGPDGAETDRRATLDEAPGAPDAALRFEGQGLHVLVMETNDALSSLPADKFAAYLAEEGLTSAIADRRREGKEGEAGRERYSRRAKALVQVGRVGPGTIRATRPLGLTLEITPEVDPYRRSADTAFPLRVTYRGRPLAGARVTMTDLAADARPATTRVTDQRGRAVFPLRRTGDWLFGTIWTRRVQNDPDADYETVFSSLSLGFPSR